MVPPTLPAAVPVTVTVWLCAGPSVVGSDQDQSAPWPVALPADAPSVIGLESVYVAIPVFAAVEPSVTVTGLLSAVTVGAPSMKMGPPGPVGLPM